MQAGLKEFSSFGMKGARLERIAADAGCAKRMVYYYFQDKEGLYLAVLADAYCAIRQTEADLDLDTLEPRCALHELARNSFEYHDQHPEFTRLVLLENLQQGAMMERLGRDAVRLREAALRPLAKILKRGEELGQFRSGLVAEDVHYLISSLSSFRVDHSETWRTLLQVDLLSEETRRRHFEILKSVLDAHVKP